jgi:hypothetical protein
MSAQRRAHACEDGPAKDAAKWREVSLAGVSWVLPASEGGALIIRSRGLLGQILEWEADGDRQENPGPWYPYVFSNPADAERLGVVNRLRSSRDTASDIPD